jgi:hypothetical protein
METFELERKDKSLIENEYQNNNSDFLGIIFSGFGYTYKNPLLYYSRNILLDIKMDYFGIDYAYTKNKYFLSLTEAEQDEYFEKDNEIIINRILEICNKYKKIIMIGKSLGTSIIRRCIKNENIKNKSIVIFITPGSEWENIIEEIKIIENKILVIGSFEDKYYNTKNLFQLHNKKNITTYELEKGDHSLEINDTIKDIEQLKNIMVKIKKIILENLL